MLLNMQGEVELTQGDFRGASVSLREALRASQESGMPKLTAEVFLNLALLEFARGNADESASMLEAASGIAEDLESRSLRVRVLLVAGRIQMEGDPRKALKELEQGNSSCQLHGRRETLQQVG